jgi:hypothetical protein
MFAGATMEISMSEESAGTISNAGPIDVPVPTITNDVGAKSTREADLIAPKDSLHTPASKATSGPASDASIDVRAPTITDESGARSTLQADVIAPKDSPHTPATEAISGPGNDDPVDASVVAKQLAETPETDSSTVLPALAVQNSGSEIAAVKVTTPAVAAPMLPAASSRPRVTAEVPERILQRVVPETQVAVVKSLFARPPVIAGQSLSDYYDLMDLVLREYAPIGYAETVLVRQIVDAEWKLVTFAAVQKMLLNLEIAEGILEQIGDRIEADDQQQNPTRFLRLRRIVLAAVCGDQAMLDWVEKQGAYIGFDAFAARHMLQDLRSHMFAESVTNGAFKQKMIAIRELEKIMAARSQRFSAMEPRPRDVMAMHAALGFTGGIVYKSLDPDHRYLNAVKDKISPEEAAAMKLNPPPPRI